MVLEDVTEMYELRMIMTQLVNANLRYSDPAEGNNKLPKILLNGNNICMVRTSHNHHLSSTNLS